MLSMLESYTIDQIRSDTDQNVSRHLMMIIQYEGNRLDSNTQRYKKTLSSLKDAWQKHPPFVDKDLLEIKRADPCFFSYYDELTAYVESMGARPFVDSNCGRRINGVSPH